MAGMALCNCNPSVRVRSEIDPDHPGQTGYSNPETLGLVMDHVST